MRRGATRKISTRLQVFSLLLSVVILIVVPNTKTAQAQLTDKYEVIATLEPPSNIESGTTLTELNFTVNYEISSVLMFSEESNISLSQGLISHWVEHQPTDVSLTDNLGNRFSPIINDTSIKTPFISNITVPSFFEYRLTLHFKTIDDAKFHDEVNNFAMAYTENQIPVPMTVTFRLPKDYAVFQCAEEADESIGDQYNSFAWKFGQGENVECFAVFMPFSIEPTVRSMGITVEVLSISPNSELRETFDMTYDLIGTVMIWNVSLVMPIYVPFPNNMSGTEVESVSDGQGSCELHTSPISPDLNPLGKYFVDNKNKLVTIYPRNSYQDTTQKCDVQITFMVPNNSSVNTMNPDIPFWKPYTGSIGLIFNFQNSSQLHLNMTGNFKLTFVFPPELGSFSSSDGERFYEGEEGGKPTFTRNYNSPINLPEEAWVVLFDNISRRNFFTSQWYYIFLLVVAVVVLYTVKRFYRFESKVGTAEAIVEMAPILALLTMVCENGREFLILGWFHWLVITGLITEIMLSIAMVILMVQIYRIRASMKDPKKKHSASTRKPQELTSHPQNPNGAIDRIQYIKNIPKRTHV